MKFLVKRAKRHDSNAFVELMESQKLTMYKVARSYLRSDDDIADAIQETILTCYEKLDSLENEQFFKTWLIRIVINECYTIMRREKRVVSLEDYTREETVSESEDYSDLYEAIGHLSDEARLSVTLYYMEGYSIKEIAKLMDTTESAVKNRLSRARAKLRTELEGVSYGCV